MRVFLFIYLFIFLWAIITDVTVLHGSNIGSPPAVGLRNDSLHVPPHLVQLHRKVGEAVHLQVNISEQFKLKTHPDFKTTLQCYLMAHISRSDLGRVGRSGCDPPQQLAARDHLHRVCSRRGNLLLSLTARLNTRNRNHAALKSLHINRVLRKIHFYKLFIRLHVFGNEKYPYFHSNKPRKSHYWRAAWKNSSVHTALLPFFSSAPLLSFFLCASNPAGSTTYRHSVHFP